MANNVNGKFPTAAERGSMEEYDSLPPEIREALRNAPFDVSTAPIFRNINVLGKERLLLRLYLDIPGIMKKSTILTYGPDHPQAK